MTTTKLAIIGDFRKENATHTATNDAVRHSLDKLQATLDAEWVETATISGRMQEVCRGYTGYLIAPGSPYADMGAVLEVIRYARENNLPVLGTCGGFQHLIIEFARNMLKITDAEHAETNPYASRLVIHPLTCSLMGQTLTVHIRDKSSLAFTCVNADSMTENYYCNFGLNPDYQQAIDNAGLRVVAVDESGEARIVELEGHPFYMGTLFVPQARSTPGAPHPLVTGFLKAVLTNNNQ